MEATGNASGGRCQFPTDAQQFRRSIVTDLTELVEDVVDGGGAERISPIQKNHAQVGQKPAQA